VADAFAATGGYLQMPEFWNGLGRALGWSGSRTIAWNGSERTHSYPLYQALRYFEVALSGGDMQTFWRKLLDRRMSA
jgi:hypothetical protein